jgi:thiol-disulfide isomerase/thioredoxin
MRRILVPLGAVALAAVVIVGLRSADGGADDPVRRLPGPGEESELALAGAPEPLAALHEQANELLGGGADAFRERLRELKGYPVVVNKWASWCGPCRREFPLFQVQALDRGKEIAFIGVNSADNRSDAERFIEEFPVSYPHYEDPDSEIAAVFKGGGPFPITAFYDAEGELAHVKYGEYRSEDDLVEDIERYAK